MAKVEYMSTNILVEEQERKSRLSWVIQKQDQKLKGEHAFELNKRNHCSRCFILKTKLGKCSMGCDE